MRGRKDLRKFDAIEWYRKAAEQDDVFFSGYAGYALGRIYSKGEGVAKNPREAFTWFLKAAQSGDFDSCKEVGIAYSHGKGTAQNYLEAYTWLLAAKRLGYDEVENELRAIAPKLSAADISAAIWESNWRGPRVPDECILD